MFGTVTPEKAITFVRLSIRLVCGWPQPSVSTKAQVLCFRISKLLSAINVFGLFLAVLSATILHSGDASAFSNAAFMAIATGQVCVLSLITTIHHDRFQRLVEIITVSVKNAKSYERNVYQRYVDTYYKFYGLTAMWNYMSAMVVIVGSIFLPQPLPTISEYPFRVDYGLVRIVIFLHQAIVGLQCSASISLNMFAALLLLYAAARYEILMIDLRESTSIDALIACVKKYHAVTRFAKDVINGTRGIAVVTVTAGSMKVVLCGLNIIGFMTLAWTTLMEVFMCALPADSLINTSTNAVRSAYESTWYDQVLAVQKTILRVLVPQEAMAIRVTCLIPALSLEYYCSYLSHAFSLFTALRMVFGEDADFLSSKSTNSTCCAD
ncbi:uncharacterized protein LOC143361303 isoform X2 [Halictus rubicundus]|uniref:uncharacterized protein LOC143361303 isoform X2 n=1 Tax=Halictus rubicundus TaxID=77578 RepID=UPI0040373829